MNPLRRALLVLAVLPGAFGSGASAGQGRAGGARIGVLGFGSPPAPHAPEDAITRHLRALGYVEGRNVWYERRYASGDRERYPALAAELLRSGVNLIFSQGSDIALAFRAAAPRLPVVFTVSDDPVAAGLVQSLARPGGQFTGISLMSPELGGKRLELLRETLPTVRRVAVLHDARHEFYMTQMRPPAERMQLDLVPIAFEQTADFGPAVAAAKQSGAQAMFVAPNRFALAYAARLAGLALEQRIPAISAYDVFAAAGGLLSYGPIQDEAVARAAALIDRILRGAKPSELPVEQPPRVALVLNLRTAKGLGITIPQAVLLRADRVIE